MEEKVGKFSSSKISNLIPLAKKKDSIFSNSGLTYIRSIVIENIKKKSKPEIDALPLIWGKSIEQFCFEQLGLEYVLESKKVIHHPTIKKWCGTPDGFKKDVVYDIKCPWTLESFFDLILCDTIEKLKEEYPEYYWQLVSNACLGNTDKAELIIFCPKEKQLSELMDYLPENSKLLFYEDSFPLLPDDIKNLFIFDYIIPESDKIFLEKRIKEAIKELFKQLEKYEKILK